MNTYTILEASEILGISKEAVYNRVRRGSLQSTLKNGVKHVLLEHASEPKKTQTSKPQPTQNNEIIELLKLQIESQNSLIRSLETKIEEIASQKEEALQRQTEQIEKIYKSYDDKIQALFAYISQTPALSHKESIDVEFEELTPYDRAMVSEDGWVSMFIYMQQRKYEPKKQKKILKKLEKISSADIKKEQGEFYIRQNKKIKDILGEK